MPERTRERHTSTPSTGYMKHIADAGTWGDPTYKVTTESSFEYASESLDEVMNDFVTPNFKRLSSQGHIINNDMTSERIAELTAPVIINKQHHHKWYTSGRWVYTPGSSFQGQVQQPDLKSFVVGYTSPLLDHLDIAVTKAYANIDESELNILESVAEANQIIPTLVQIFGKLIKVLIAIKKLQFKALRNLLTPKELAKEWLALRYGIRPLISDGRNIVKALVKDLDYDRRTYRGSAHGQTLKTQEFVWENSFSGQGAYEIDILSTTALSRQCRAGVLCQIEDLSKPYFYGVDKILETSWELVPWSFVFDWFLNIGDTIAAWSPNIGFRTLGAWSSQYDVITCQVTAGSGRALACHLQQDATHVCLENTLECVGGSFAQMIVRKARTANPDRPILPHWRINLDISKLIDAMALIRMML